MFIMSPHPIWGQRFGINWIGLDWSTLFRVDKTVEKNQINECIIQVLVYISRYVSLSQNY